MFSGLPHSNPNRLGFERLRRPGLRVLRTAVLLAWGRAVGVPVLLRMLGFPAWGRTNFPHSMQKNGRVSWHCVPNSHEPQSSHLVSVDTGVDLGKAAEFSCVNRKPATGAAEFYLLGPKLTVTTCLHLVRVVVKEFKNKFE